MDGYRRTLRDFGFLILGGGLATLYLQLKSPAQTADSGIEVAKVCSPAEAAPVADAPPYKEVKIVPGQHLSVSVPKTSRPPEDLQLSLSPEELDDLERREPELEAKLRVSRTATGWRVQLLTPDPAVEGIGLRSGDLITYESLKAQVQNPERAVLATRMTNFLDRLAR